MRPMIKGAAVSIEIQEGRQIIGRLGSHGHLSWERQPGEVRIIDTKNPYKPLKFQALGGKTYYAAWEVHMFDAHGQLRLLSEEEGIEMLRSCSRKPKSASNQNH